MATLDPLQVNEDLKKANEKLVSAIIGKLKAEHKRRTTLELMRCNAASKAPDGKLSESAGERMAKTTPEYIKASEEEISAIEAEEKARIDVEYQRGKLQAALVLAKP